jgi:hypothetical protein
MAKYTVTVQVEANGEWGLNQVIVEAGGIHVGPEWVVLTVDSRDLPGTVVAAFPRARVVSLVTPQS